MRRRLRRGEFIIGLLRLRSLGFGGLVSALVEDRIEIDFSHGRAHDGSFAVDSSDRSFEVVQIRLGRNWGKGGGYKSNEVTCLDERNRRNLENTTW